MDFKVRCLIASRTCLIPWMRRAAGQDTLDRTGEIRREGSRVDGLVVEDHHQVVFRGFNSSTVFYSRRLECGSTIIAEGEADTPVVAACR